MRHTRAGLDPRMGRGHKRENRAAGEDRGTAEEKEGSEAWKTRRQERERSQADHGRRTSGKHGQRGCGRLPDRSKHAPNHPFGIQSRGKNESQPRRSKQGHVCTPRSRDEWRRTSSVQHKLASRGHAQSIWREPGGMQDQSQATGPCCTWWRCCGASAVPRGCTSPAHRCRRSGNLGGGGGGPPSGRCQAGSAQTSGGHLHCIKRHIWNRRMAQSAQ
mmetsp:Transcript_2177/g.14396  ORF Transcript_2177/g.14396 Transcript_2177/m.14396 type:complete len:217 (+) Transcript_2177:567-1217(+)